MRACVVFLCGLSLLLLCSGCRAVRVPTRTVKVPAPVKVVPVVVPPVVPRAKKQNPTSGAGRVLDAAAKAPGGPSGGDDEEQRQKRRGR